MAAHHNTKLQQKIIFKKDNCVHGVSCAMASAYSSGAVVSAMVRMRAESGVRMPSATLAMDNERRGVSVLGNA